MYPEKIATIEVSKDINLVQICIWLQSKGHSISLFKETDNYYRFDQTNLKSLKENGYNHFISKSINESINFIIAKHSNQSIPPVAVAVAG